MNFDVSEIVKVVSALCGDIELYGDHGSDSNAYDSTLLMLNVADWLLDKVGKEIVNSHLANKGFFSVDLCRNMALKKLGEIKENIDEYMDSEDGE